MKVQILNMFLPPSLNEIYVYVSSFGRGGRGGSVNKGRGGRFSSGGSNDRDRLKCEYYGRSRHTKD